MFLFVGMSTKMLVNSLIIQTAGCALATICKGMTTLSQWQCLGKKWMSQLWHCVQSMLANLTNGPQLEVQLQGSVGVRGWLVIYRELYSEVCKTQI